MKRGLSDRELVDGIQRGGAYAERCLKHLYQNQRMVITRLLTKRGATEAQAVDAFQEAVICAYENIRAGKFRAESGLGSYISSIALFIWLHQQRKSDRARRHLAELSEEQMKAASDVESFLHQERNDLVRQLLDRLPEPCRKILQYAYYQGYSMEEIARRFEFKNAQVARNKKSRCLKRLKELLNTSEQLNLYFKDSNS